MCCAVPAISLLTRASCHTQSLGSITFLRRIRSIIAIITILEISSQADKKPEMKRLISRVKRDQERERARHNNGHEEGAVKRFQLPKKYMQQEEFVKCIQESGIVKDHGTILRLFDALTVGQCIVSTPLPRI